MVARARRKVERGDTLIELILSVAILGGAALTIVAAITYSITATDTHRQEATASAAVRDYAETIEQTVSNGNYAAGTAAYPAYAAPTGYTASMTSKKCWTTVAGKPGWATCNAGNDAGVQQLTLQIAAPRATESLVVVVRTMRPRTSDMQLSRFRPRKDRGFTLIELLIAIVILGVIAFPLASIVIDYLINTATTSAQLDEATDEQITAAYWQQDVSSIGVRGPLTGGTFPLKQSIDTALPAQCALPAGSTRVITLAWDQYDATGKATAVTVAYAAKGTTLIRLRCSGTTLTYSSTITRHLSAAPTVTCAGSAGTNCASYTGASVPTTVTMTLVWPDLSHSGQTITATLTGQRRQT